MSAWASCSQPLSPVDNSNQYKRWHEGVPRKFNAQVTRTTRRTFTCHLCALSCVLTISCVYSAVRNFGSTQSGKAKVCRMLKKKENKSRQLSAFSEIRDIKQSWVTTLHCFLCKNFLFQSPESQI